jgi:hypothetical protein
MRIRISGSPSTAAAQREEQANTTEKGGNAPGSIS